jgi:hypothetical protein
VGRGIKLSDFFPDYKGDDTLLETVQQFILNLFIKLRRHDSGQLFYHYTTAIDTGKLKSQKNRKQCEILV